MADKKPKKQKKKSGSSKVWTHKYFNVRDRKEFTAEALITNARANASVVLYTHGVPFKEWCTFVELEEMLVRYWDSSFDEGTPFFWCDRLINELGYMIWNEMFRKYFNEVWFKNGILLDVPELSKKLRKNPEAVATHFANSAVDKYSEQYL